MLTDAEVDLLATGYSVNTLMLRASSTREGYLANSGEDVIMTIRFDCEYRLDEDEAELVPGYSLQVLTGFTGRLQMIPSAHVI